MKPLANDVNKIIYNLFRKRSPILAELIVNWGKIVGIKYSQKSYPLKILTTKNNGKRVNILQVAAVSSSVSVELSYQQSLMIERISIYLGYKAIEQIKIVVR